MTRSTDWIARCRQGERGVGNVANRFLIALSHLLISKPPQDQVAKGTDASILELDRGGYELVLKADDLTLLAQIAAL